MSCNDTSLGIVPKDLTASNSKLNNITSVNKLVACNVSSGNVITGGLIAEAATINTLEVKNLIATLESQSGSVIVNNCGVPQTWTITGTVSKTGKIVLLNLTFIRNAPNFIAPCSPAGTLSSGFAPTLTSYFSAVLFSAGNYYFSPLIIDTAGNISVSTGPTDQAGDTVFLTASYETL